MSVFVILLTLFIGCIISSTETPNVFNKKTLESIVPSATSQEYGGQPGGTAPVAGTRWTLPDGTIWEFTGTPGIMPRIIPVEEPASDPSKPIPKSKPN